MNAGVDGYSMSQIRLFAEELLPIVDPDLVVAGVFVAAQNRVKNPFVLVGDHLVYETMSERVEFANQGYIYSGFKRPWLVRLEIWCNKHFYVGAYILRGAQRVGSLFERVVKRAEPSNVEEGDRLQPFLYELSSLQTLADSYDVPIVFLLIATQLPDGSVSSREVEQHKITMEYCNAQALVCVDTLPTILELASTGELARFPNDSHWNAAGHELAAEFLIESPVFPVHLFQAER